MRVSVCAIALVCGCGARGLPRLPDSTVQSDKQCTSESCDPVPRLIDPKAPATLWSVRFEGGELKLPADSRVDWYGLVLRGELRAADCGVVSAWRAFRIPSGGGSIRGHGDCVIGIASDRPLGELGPLGGGKPGTCESVALGDLPEVTWASGKAHARLAFRAGRSYFGLLYSDPGAGSPPHAHGGEWEVVHVLRGRGEIRSGDELAPLVAGVSLAFSPGLRHGFHSSGDTPTVAVQMYTPAGAEQRFLDLAAKD
jgi:mannose-6-phosphate isomerase-like protein (cupin superfamily)